ncbi:MAG: SNF2-related protein [Actinomycetaceae bacterium]|nr:SNF2-related protein [Actinomycetaceae bacterium]
MNDGLLHLINSQTQGQLEKLVGHAAYAMGAADFDKNQVKEVITDWEEGRIKARVAHGAFTYSCWIAASDDASGTLQLSCACRAGSNCRHTVAAVLWIKSHKADVTPHWREIFAPLERAQTGDGQLGLHLDFNTALLTPRRLSQGKEWTKNRASWRDITNRTWNSVTDDLDPAQLSALRRLWDSVYVGQLGAAGSKANFSLQLEQLGAHAFASLAQVREAGVRLLHTPLNATSTGGGEDTLDLQLASTPAAVKIATTATGEKVLASWQLHYQQEVYDLRASKSQIAIFNCKPRLLGIGNQLVPLTPDSEAPLNVASLHPQVEIPSQDVAEFDLLLQGGLSHLAATEQTTSRVLVCNAKLEDPAEGGRAYVQWQVETLVGETTYTKEITSVPERSGPVFDLIREVASRVDFQISPLVPPMRVDVWQLAQIVRKGENATSDLPVRWQTQCLPDERSLLPASVRMKVSPKGTRTATDSSGEEAGLVLGGTWQQSRETDSGLDWFEVEVSVGAQGQRVKLSEVIRALGRGEPGVLAEGGAWVSVEGADFLQLRQLLDSLREDEGVDAEVISVPSQKIPLLGVAQELGWEVQWKGKSAQYADKLQYLRGEFEAHPQLEKPNGITLRNYQVSAISWLLAVTELGHGGVLADDMGLGKTVQVLSFIATYKKLRECGPVLVCAPTSVVGVWQQEAAKYFPELRVKVVQATAAKQPLEFEKWQENYDVVVTSWTLLRLDRTQYWKGNWSGVVLDEAQAVKNPQTQTHLAVRKLKRDWALAVTGTPIENSISDLWSILALTNPGLLPGRKKFIERYGKQLETQDGRQALSQLLRLIMPFIRRRTKEEVATELPAKTTQILEVELDAKHRAQYQRELVAIQRQLAVGGEDQQQMGLVLSSLTRLRLLSLDPSLTQKEDEPPHRFSWERQCEDSVLGGTAIAAA